MRTGTFRVAPMSVTLNAQTCLLTSDAATPSEWKAETGFCMNIPITEDTSTSCTGENILTSNNGWDIMTLN
ncbi:unnamed protein product [Staurois parvus]|uniref:Uncharacterized protein n=1 Tax=Staurois parvus TaxID=386267 RepID=A0ABN9AJJ3_9NEOB|nr:unnamed protein product [Staurois parvus]